jgi:hypothetical protein
MTLEMWGTVGTLIRGRDRSRWIADQAFDHAIDLPVMEGPMIEQGSAAVALITSW